MMYTWAVLLVVLPAALCSPTWNQLLQDYAERFPNPDVNDPNPEYGEHYEGDILVDGSTKILDDMNPLNAIPNRKKRWPSGILYYEIQEKYSDLQISQIKAGVDDLVEVTKVNGENCIEIRERGRTDTHVKDYVYIFDNGGCSSYLGRIGGPQRMSLSSSCIKRHGTIMHEFLHAYGFHHEQKRTDRDDYVYVNYDNIRSDAEKNFKKLEEDKIDLLGTLYDYGSVLHYSAYSFAVDRSIPNIVPHDPKAEIGQRLALSDLDIERVQIFYECLKPEDSVYFKHLAGRRIFE